MKKSSGTDLGLQNRFDALVFNTSVHPLEAKSKTVTKRSKKLKQKKDKSKSKTESEKAQTKWKDPQVQSNKTVKSIKSTNKPAAKPAKPGKSAVAEPKVPLEVTFKRTLTLDEYREANKVNLCRAPQYNLRQPGEGEDPSQWGKLVPLLKKKYQQEYETCERKQRAGRERRLPVPVMLGDSLESAIMTRRDMNAACRAAEAAAAAARTEPVQRQRPPKVNSKREFPTLGN